MKAKKKLEEARNNFKKSVLEIIEMEGVIVKFKNDRLEHTGYEIKEGETVLFEGSISPDKDYLVDYTRYKMFDEKSLLKIVLEKYKKEEQTLKEKEIKELEYKLKKLKS